MQGKSGRTNSELSETHAPIDVDQWKKLLTVKYDLFESTENPQFVTLINECMKLYGTVCTDSSRLVSDQLQQLGLSVF